MVRLWSWLAYAHGVDMVAYFRWRQAPFAQEQFHAGLLLPDSAPDQAFYEVEQVIRELPLLPENQEKARSDVALVLDYQSRWAAEVLPQGRSYKASANALDWYSALSRHGVDIDIIGPHVNLDGYKLIVIPDMAIANPDFVARLAASGAQILLGPRSGSKTADMHIPANLPPGPLSELIDVRISRVESLPDYHNEPVLFGNVQHRAKGWRESIVTSETVLATFEGSYRKGAPAYVGNDKTRYLATLPDAEFLRQIMVDALEWAGVARLPDLGDLRIARRGSLTFAFNFGAETADIPASSGARLLIGDRRVKPADLAVWMETNV